MPLSNSFFAPRGASRELPLTVLLRGLTLLWSTMMPTSLLSSEVRLMRLTTSERYPVRLARSSQPAVDDDELPEPEPEPEPTRRPIDSEASGITPWVWFHWKLKLPLLEVYATERGLAPQTR